MTSRIGGLPSGPMILPREVLVVISLALRGELVANGRHGLVAGSPPAAVVRGVLGVAGVHGRDGMDVAAAAALSVELGALARVHRLPSRAGGASRETHGGRGLVGVSRMHLRRTGTPTSVATGCGARFGALGDAIRLDAVSARVDAIDAGRSLGAARRVSVCGSGRVLRLEIVDFSQRSSRGLI